MKVKSLLFFLLLVSIFALPGYTIAQSENPDSPPLGIVFDYVASLTGSPNINMGNYCPDSPEVNGTCDYWTANGVSSPMPLVAQPGNNNDGIVTYQPFVIVLAIEGGQITLVVETVFTVPDHVEYFIDISTGLQHISFTQIGHQEAFMVWRNGRPVAEIWFDYARQIIQIANLACDWTLQVFDSCQDEIAPYNEEEAGTTRNEDGPSRPIVFDYVWSKDASYRLPELYCSGATITYGCSLPEMGTSFNMDFTVDFTTDTGTYYQPLFLTIGEDSTSREIILPITPFEPIGSNPIDWVFNITLFGYAADMFYETDTLNNIITISDVDSNLVARFQINPLNKTFIIRNLTCGYNLRLCAEQRTMNDYGIGLISFPQNGHANSTALTQERTALFEDSGLAWHLQNPIQSELVLNFEAPLPRQTSLDIFGMGGNLVHSSILPMETTNFRMPVSNFAKGTYLLRLSNDNGTEQRIVIIQ